jgi:hypothetical protein
MFSEPLWRKFEFATKNRKPKKEKKIVETASNFIENYFPPENV